MAHMSRVVLCDGVPMLTVIVWGQGRMCEGDTYSVERLVRPVNWSAMGRDGKEGGGGCETRAYTEENESVGSA